MQLMSERRKKELQSTMGKSKHQRNISEAVVRTKYGRAVGGGGVSTHNIANFNYPQGMTS